VLIFFISVVEAKHSFVTLFLALAQGTQNDAVPSLIPIPWPIFSTVLLLQGAVGIAH
jgi:hypothetical protein